MKIISFQKLILWPLERKKNHLIQLLPISINLDLFFLSNDVDRLHKILSTENKGEREKIVY